MQSVNVVRITPAERAGSIFSRRSVSGTSTPTAAAASRLMSIAAAMMPAIFQVPNQNVVMTPMTAAQMRPFRPPTAISLNSSQRALLHSNLPEREAANDQRDRLRAGDAAHARDDRHQRRQRRDLLDGAFEPRTTSPARIAVSRLMPSQNRRRLRRTRARPRTRLPRRAGRPCSAPSARLLRG